MGTYVDQQYFLDNALGNEIIARTDRDRAGEVDLDVLEEFITAAEGEVNAALRAGAYETPLTAPVDPSIPPLVLDVCRWRYWVGANPPDEVTLRYKRATDRLLAIQKGHVALDLSDAGPGKGSVIDYRAPDRIFTDETLEGY